MYSAQVRFFLPNLHEEPTQCVIVDVLPLVYNALDSEHPAVQERALAAVPELCDTIDYAELQGVLFPRVAVCSFLFFQGRERANESVIAYSAFSPKLMC